MDQLNRKKKLRLYASEMATFCHYFSLIVGYLIPEGNPVWDFFCNLLQIIDMLMSNFFKLEMINRLEDLIESHNQKYIQLFDYNLKPKFHLLLHYPRIIQQSGPPRQMWSFRFE